MATELLAINWINWGFKLALNSENIVILFITLS